MDLTTEYMGLMLRSPLVASASPLNADLGNIRALEDAGAGAVVLPSIFAEQIASASSWLDDLTGARAFNSPKADDVSAPDLYRIGPDRYLELVGEARGAIDMPVIASLNAAHVENWVRYATLLQEAGASALELNIYLVPTDVALGGRDVEQRYIDIVQAVKAQVTIPVAVKIGPYFSSPAGMAWMLTAAGADGLVLFNRFYQPDIDVAHMRVKTDLELSRPAEARLALLWIAVLRGRLRASLAASTGVHSAEDVVKYLLAGADVVMSTSALLKYGIGHMQTLVEGLGNWLREREIDNVARIRGLLSQGGIDAAEDQERANYIKILQSYAQG